MRLEDADDPAFDPAVFLDALDAHDHAIAVHRFVEVRAGHVDVAAVSDRALGHDEAVARRMRFEAPDVQVHFFGQPEALAANLNEFARGDERLEMTPERGALFARNFEQL